MNTRRQLISFLLALFMVLGTITPLFAENDSVTVLPPRMADKTEEPEDNIVILNGDREEKEETKDSPIILENNRDESNVEEKEADKDAPVILENRDDNNVTILPPITNEEKTTEPEPKEEQKKEDEKSKAPVEVQVLSKRETTDGDKKEEGKVSLVLLNDKPASVNEEVYSKIKWIKDDFSIDNDKILGLSEEGLKKVKANKKLVIPEIENITTIEKQAFMNLGLRVVEIPNSITLIEEEAFKDNGLTKVVINGKNKTIAGNAFGGDFLNEYKKNEEEVFLYEFEGLEIGEEMVSEAVGSGEPDDLSFFTFDGTTITGLTEEGQTYYSEHPYMVLPGVNPEGELITEIGYNAFKFRGLKDVDLSNMEGLIIIREYAFYHNYIKNVDFSNCSNLMLIKRNAFQYNGIESISFFNCLSLRCIESKAFDSNKIPYVNLIDSKNIEIIANDAFDNNYGSGFRGKVVVWVRQNLRYVIGPQSASDSDNYNWEVNRGESRIQQYDENDFLYSLKPDGTYSIDRFSSDGQIKFMTNRGKFSIYFDSFNGKKITSISENAFSDYGIYEIDISGLKYLETIEKNAFLRNSIEKINLNQLENLENIEDNVFAYNRLDYIGAPLSLKNLSETAFEGNNNKVKVFTFDGTNPNNLKDSEYHVINPELNGDELVLFTFDTKDEVYKSVENDELYIDYDKSAILTGLSGLGKKYFETHHNLIISHYDMGGNCVRTIGLSAFEGLDLESVDFSNSESIEKIEPGAFRNNNLAELDLEPVSMLETIGTLAFAENKLKNVKFPYQVQNLAYDAFKDNIGSNAEKQVFIESDNQFNLPDTEYHIFKDPYDETPVLASDNLDFFTFDGATITGLTDLGKKNYKNNSTMVLPGVNKEGERITVIGDNAFNGIGISSINFGKIDSLTKIGKNAFSNNNIDRVDLRPLKDLTLIDDEAFSNSKINHISLDNLKKLEKIGKRAFADNNIQNTYLDLRSNYSLNTIDEEAFKNNKLTIAKTPLNLLTLVSNAFEGNTGFKDGKVYVYTADGTNPKNLQNSDYHLINPKMEESNSSLFKYEETEDGVTLLGLSDIGEIYVKQNPDKEIIIPSKTDTGVSIARIADNAFNEKNLNLTFEENANLTYIGDHAFFKNKIKSLDLNKFSSLASISPYAFAHNEIKELAISNTLATISKYAFRDNELEKLDTKNVKTIEEGAFSNNNLKELTLGATIEVIKDYAFKQNDLTNVEIPKTIKEFGKMVFTFNNRYVRVKTESDLIKTEKVGRAFGHVVNSIIITVQFYDKTNKGLICEDKKMGNDYSDINGVFIAGEENIFYPPKFKNYISPDEVKFVPSGKDYYLRIDYISTKTSPVLKVNNDRMFNLNEVISEDDLKSLATATDFMGNDISDKIEVSPKTLDTTSGGLKNVTYSVTDEYGNTAITEVEIPVAIDWKDFPLGEGWVLGDFEYDIPTKTLKGFSEQGKNKIGGRDRIDLVLPGVIPVEGVESYNKLPKIENIAERAFDTKTIWHVEKEYLWYTVGLDSLDLSHMTGLKKIGKEAFLGNVKFKSGLDFSNSKDLEIIEEKAFSGMHLYYINFSGLSKLRSIGDKAFYGNEAREINFNGCINLREFGEYSFSFCRPQTLDLSHLINLEKIDEGAFASNRISSVNFSNLTKLKSIGGYAFASQENMLTYLDFSGLISLESIGEAAFNFNKVEKIDFSGCKNLTTVSKNAFYFNLNLKEIKMYGCTSFKEFDDMAFSCVDGDPNYNGLVVVWTDESLESRILSKYNYIVNPKSDFNKAFSEDDFLYRLKADSTYEIIGFSPMGAKKIKGNDFNLKIDFNSYKNKPITSIGDRAFFLVYLKSLDLSGLSNLERIGKYSFSGEYRNPVYANIYDVLTKVNLSGLSNLKIIDEMAFASNWIKEINLAGLKNLEVIGKAAFARNRVDIENIDLSDCVTLKIIDDEAFKDSNVKNIVLPTRASIETIGKQAFYRDYLKNFEFSKLQNLKVIRDEAFVENKLTKVDLSNLTNLEVIGSEIFRGNKVDYINLSGLTNLKEISAKAFLRCKSSSIDLSGAVSLEKIGYSAFENLGISNLNLSNTPNLKIIGDNAFNKNYISNIDLSSCLQLEHIGNNSFSNNKLKEAIIPENLSYIGYDAFNKNIGANLKKDVYLFTPSRTNPNNLTDGYAYIINPLELAIDYITDKNEIIMSTPYEITSSGRQMVLPTFPGYMPSHIKETGEILSSNNWSIKLNKGGKQKIHIVYKKEFIDVKNGVDLSMSLKKSLNKNPYNYYIGSEQRIDIKYNVKEDIPNIESSKILVSFPFYVEKSSIKVPEHMNIKSFSINNHLLEINLQNITRNTSLEIPILFNLQKEKTPANTAMSITAIVKDSSNKSIHELLKQDFTGYYNNPKFYITADNSDGFESYYSWEDGPRSVGVTAKGIFADKNKKMVIKPYDFKFGFMLSTGWQNSLEREIEGYEININLPSYNAYDENGNVVKRDAVFKQGLNPSWTLNNGIISYKLQDVKNNSSFAFPALPDLFLSFPNAIDMDKIELESNISMVPKNQGLNEPKIDLNDNLEIKLTGKRAIFVSGGNYRDTTGIYMLPSHIRYNKDFKNYIYDTVIDREEYVSWVGGFHKDDKHKDYTNLILSIDEFDNRYSVNKIKNREDINLQYNLYSNGKLIDSFNLKTKDEEKPISVTFDKLEIIANEVVNKDFSFEIFTIAKNPNKTLGKDKVRMELKGSTSAVLENNPNSRTNYELTGKSFYQIIPFEYEINAKIVQSIKSENSVVSGDVVDYKVGLCDYVTGIPLNNGKYFTKNLDNFVMIQKLPKNAEIKDIKLSESFKNSKESSYEIISLGGGYNAIVFKAKSLDKGTYNIADVTIYTASSMNTGTHKSTVYATWDSDYIDKHNPTIPTEDIKDYISQSVTQDEVSFNLLTVKSVFSEKYIKTNNGFFRASETKDGNIDYILKVVNNTDEDRNNVELIDILPYEKDSRGSKVDVVLREAIKLSEGEVLYTTDINPSFDSVFTKTYSENVTAFKIKVPKVGRNETFDIEVKAKFKNTPKTKKEILAFANKAAINDFWRTDDLTTTPVKTNPVKTTYEMPKGRIRFIKYGLKKSFFGFSYKKKPLQGAEFELRDIDGNFIQKSISDINGLVEFSGIKIGDYIVREVEPPKGYNKAKDFRISSEDFKLENNEFLVDINSEVINESVRKGNLTIKKTTSKGNPLKDVEFYVQGTSSFNSNFKEKVSTNSNGEAFLKNIPEGEYKVTEIEKLGDKIKFIPAPPQTFKIEQTKDEIVLEDQEIKLNFINDKVKFRIYKIVYGENEVIPDNLNDVKTFNRSKLEGATFDVTINGETKKYVTNMYGYIDIEAPTNTTVKIKETKAPVGYKLYNKEINVTITDDGQISEFDKGAIYVPNVMKKLSGRLIVKKVDENDQSKLLSGAKFEITKNDKKYDEKTTDSSELVFNLNEEGVYFLKETKAPLGYYLRDKDNSEKIEVRRPSSRYNDIPLNSEEFKNLLNSDGNEDFYASNDDEIIFYKKLIIPNTPLDFDLYKYETILKNATYEEVEKFYEDESYEVIYEYGDIYRVTRALEGAEFDIYEEDKKVGSAISDKEGKIDVSNIPWDTDKVYYLYETKTPSEKFQLLQSPIVLDFKEIINNADFYGVVERKIENKPYKGKIIISKYRNDENEIMEGQEFTLYKDSVSEENKLMTKATDKSGLIEFSDLELGHYIVKETKVDEGWALSKDEYVSDLTVESPASVHKIFNTAKTIKFTVKKVDEQGNPMEGVLFALYNAESPDLPKTPGPKQKIEDMYGKKKLEFDYYEDYKEFIVGNNNNDTKPIKNNNGEGLNIVEDTEVGTFELEISDDGPDKNTPVGEPGDGGKGYLHSYVEPQEANIHMVMESDRYGIINFEIPYGNYILREVKTKDGYVLSQKTHLITPESEGKVYEYVNYPIEIPKTGTLGVVPYIAIGLLLVAGAYIVLKKKEEKSRD